MGNKIEILSMDYFSTYYKETEFVERMKECLSKEIGWHYLLDLAWIMREIRSLEQGSLILDAGGGNGLTQFILSEMGYNVINADFSNPVLSKKVTDRYESIMSYLNNHSDVTYDNRYTRHLYRAHNIPIDQRRSVGHDAYPQTRDEVLSYINKKRKPQQNMRLPEKRGAIPYYLKNNVEEKCGRVFLYKCDLKNMSLIPDNFLDGIVSISALEHNDHEDFRKCVDELLRVVKPGGKLAITVSASQNDDWFHKESNGWCYSEQSLRDLFKLSGDVPCNYSQKDELFRKLCVQDNELQKRLASFHSKSGKNGMPWGIWKPSYQPVGVVRIKEGSKMHGNNNEKGCLVKR
jgi:ubiquinone/menaquinone biosynthesis C-methylase UbiE